MPTNYKLSDRLYEPGSYIGALVLILGAAIPALVPPAVWSHLAGCGMVLLGTANIFIPDNRIVGQVAGVLSKVETALPASYQIDAAGLANAVAQALASAGQITAPAAVGQPVSVTLGPATVTPLPLRPAGGP